MQFVKTQQALAFAPLDQATQQIAEAFASNFEAWTKRLGAAKRELKAFVDEKVGVKVQGITARDQMLMASFGLVFEKNPGAGFMRAPNEIAESVRRQGIRGEVYFPDIQHPIGSEVMKRLNTISKTASERPLLNGVAGLRAAAIDGNRLVLSSVSKQDSQIVILAAKGAVSPTAALKVIEAPAPAQVADAFLERVAEASKAQVAAPRAPLMSSPKPF